MQWIALKNSLWSNLTLKIVSLALGYQLWLVIGQTSTVKMWLTLPLSFYDVPDTIVLDAPETINVQLIGVREDLRNIDQQTVAIHCNTAAFKKGKQTISLSEQNLLLPNRVKVVNWSPSNIVVDVKEKVDCT